MCCTGESALQQLGVIIIRMVFLVLQSLIEHRSRGMKYTFGTCMMPLDIRWANINTTEAEAKTPDRHKWLLRACDQVRGPARCA